MTEMFQGLKKNKGQFEKTEFLKTLKGKLNFEHFLEKKILNRSYYLDEYWTALFVEAVYFFDLELLLGLAF